MKKLSLMSVLFVFLTTILFSSGSVNAASISSADEIAKAKKEGKTVFLVITGKSTTDFAKAEKIAKDANQKVKKSVVVKLNKDEAANSGLVSKYGIANVPVPFLLVISPKGVATGGYASDQATVEQLIKAIPSPKQDEALLALNEKKPVYIVVSKKSLKDKAAIVANCKAASAKVASKPPVIEIDIDDAAEKAFLTQIGVTTITDKSIVVVANGTGQITETFKETPTIEKLTAAANKIVKSGGCCPGGSSKGCGK